MDHLTFLTHLQQKQALIHQTAGRGHEASAPSQRLGQYLAAARQHGRLTLQELAMLTELTPEQLMALENGLIPPAEVSPVWLGRLAAALETDAQTLHFLLRPGLNLHPRPEAKPGRVQLGWPNLTLGHLLGKMGQFFHRLRHPRQWSIPMVVGLIVLAFLLVDAARLGWASYNLQQELDTRTQTWPNYLSDNCVGLGCNSYNLTTHSFAYSDQAVYEVELWTPGLDLLVGSVPISAQLPDRTGMSSYTPPAGQATPPKLIQEAQLQLQVSDPAGARNQLQQVIQQYNGQLLNQRTQTENNQTFVFLVVQVEPTQLMAFLQAVKQTAGGVVLLEHITNQDVSKQYVDLTAQLTNLELTEQELQQLLTAAQENGNSAGEVLEIFTELSTIRGSIEKIKGELNLLNQRVAWSAVEIELRQNSPTPENEGFNIGQTFQQAWHSVQVVGQWLATAGVWLLVYSPLWLGLGGLYKWQQWRKKEH